MLTGKSKLQNAWSIRSACNAAFRSGTLREWLHPCNNGHNNLSPNLYRCRPSHHVFDANWRQDYPRRMLNLKTRKRSHFALHRHQERIPTL